jgi:hypothetical protein
MTGGPASNGGAPGSVAHRSPKECRGKHLGGGRPGSVLA